MNREMRARWLLLPGLTALAAIIWSSDKVTLQGERTVYTVACLDGRWQGTRCSGHLSPASRYRFRALKPDREVLFWSVGEAKAPSKLTECEITDGRNWNCSPSNAANGSVVLRMLDGKPVFDPLLGDGRLHAVAKWHWYLLRWGFALRSEADY